jgi:hypothetical protein
MNGPKGGSLDVAARATKKVEEIFARHFPDHIP